MVAGVASIVIAGAGSGSVTLTTVVEAAAPPGPVQVRVKRASPTATGVTVITPDVDCTPDHAPLPEQSVAPVDDQLNEIGCPSLTVATLAESEIVGAAGAAETVTVVERVPEPPGPVQVSE